MNVHVRMFKADLMNHVSTGHRKHDYCITVCGPTSLFSDTMIELKCILQLLCAAPVDNSLFVPFLCLPAQFARNLQPCCFISFYLFMFFFTLTHILKFV